MDVLHPRSKVSLKTRRGTPSSIKINYACLGLRSQIFQHQQMAIRFYFFLNVQGCKGDKLVFTQYAKEGGEGTGIHGAKLTQVYGEE